MGSIAPLPPGYAAPTCRRGIPIREKNRKLFRLIVVHKLPRCHAACQGGIDPGFGKVGADYGERATRAYNGGSVAGDSGSKGTQRPLWESGIPGGVKVETPLKVKRFCPFSYKRGVKEKDLSHSFLPCRRQTDSRSHDQPPTFGQCGPVGAVLSAHAWIRPCALYKAYSPMTLPDA